MESLDEQIGKRDPAMFALFNKLAAAHDAHRAAQKKRDKGKLPDTDEAMQPYFDRISAAEAAILKQPATSLAGLRIKAQLALRLVDLSADFKVPRTPEQAYELVAKEWDFSAAMFVVSLWGDIERLAAKA